MLFFSFYFANTVCTFPCRRILEMLWTTKTQWRSVWQWKALGRSSFLLFPWLMGCKISAHIKSLMIQVNWNWSHLSSNVLPMILGEPFVSGSKLQFFAWFPCMPNKTWRPMEGDDPQGDWGGLLWRWLKINGFSVIRVMLLMVQKSRPSTSWGNGSWKFHYLRRVFYIQPVVVWDFFQTINSMTSRYLYMGNDPQPQRSVSDVVTTLEVPKSWRSVLSHCQRFVGLVELVGWGWN